MIQAHLLPLTTTVKCFNDKNCKVFPSPPEL